MALETPQIKFDPYTPQIPILPVPQDVQPTGSSGPLPTQAGYMGKTGAAADLINETFRGFMRGHAELAQKKAQQANYALDLANKNEANALATYQDSLATGKAKPGDTNDPAYQAYLAAHKTTSDTMEKVAIPDKKPKGEKGQKKKTDDKTQQPKTLAGRFQEFFAANPHIIPQALITARVPHPPTMTADTAELKNRLTEQANNITLQGQGIESNKQAAQEHAQELQRQEQRRAVEQAGGYEKVIEDPNASPQLKQTAYEMRSTYLDSAGPDAQAKFQYGQDLKSGDYMKKWTQGDWMRAGTLGVVPMPQEVTVEKGGKAYLELINPTTNQPIPGSKPLYVGPSSEAKQMAGFFAERNAMRNDLAKAVKENPEMFGWKPTGDKQRDEATAQAITDSIFIAKEEGIQSIVGLTGKPASVVTRDNMILDDVNKSLDKLIHKDGKVEPGKASFDWPGQADPKTGSKVMLSADDVRSILSQFIGYPEDERDVYKFLDTPVIPPGKDWKAAERDRQWVYQVVKNRMMAAKGKNAKTAQEADAILKGTALGKPITGPDQVQQQNTQGATIAGTANGSATSATPIFVPGRFGGSVMQGPPTSSQRTTQIAQGPPTGGTQSGSKIYIIDGQAVEMTPEEAEKARAAGYRVVDSPPDFQALSQNR